MNAKLVPSLVDLAQRFEVQHVFITRHATWIGFCPAKSMLMLTERCGVASPGVRDTRRRTQESASGEARWVSWIKGRTPPMHARTPTHTLQGKKEHTAKLSKCVFDVSSNGLHTCTPSQHDIVVLHYFGCANTTHTHTHTHTHTLCCTPRLRVSPPEMEVEPGATRLLLISTSKRLQQGNQESIYVSFSPIRLILRPFRLELSMFLCGRSRCFLLQFTRTSFSVLQHARHHHAVSPHVVAPLLVLRLN